MQVVGNNSVTTLRDTNVGLPSDKGILSVYGEVTINGATAKGQNTAGTGSLTVIGPTTLNNTLTVAGIPKFTTLGNGTSTRLVIADALGALSTQAIPTPIDAILNQNTNDQTANFRIGGTGRIGSTLSVGGATTLAGLSAGSTSLGSTSISGTLGVTGATTLAGLSAGATALSSTLSVAGIPKFSTLGGTGTRLVVADDFGSLSTQAIPGPGDYIQNQISGNQAANFRINGSGQVNSSMTVGTALTVGTTLGVSGASTLSSLGVTNNTTLGGALSVAGATTLDGLSAGTTTLSAASVTNALLVGGSTTLGSTLGVTGATTLAGLSAGTTTLGVAKVSNLSGTGTRLVVADASGTLSTQPVPTPIDAILNQNTTEQVANFHINGSGQVGSMAINANATIGGNGTVTGALGVIGATNLATLSTSGLATLNSARVAGLTVAGMVVNDASGNLSTQPIPVPVNAILNQNTSTQSANFQISGSGQVGSLTVNNTATIGGNSTIAGTLGVSGASTLSSLGVTNNTTLGGALGVAGATTLIGATALGSTLGVMGNTTLAGLSAGATTLESAKVSGLGGTGSRVVLADNTGALTATNVLPGSNGEFIANTGTAAIPAFSILGSGQIGTTLGVTGATTLGGLTAGATSLSSTSVSGTLGVTGATTLTGLTAGATTLASATVTNALSAATIGTSGVATLASAKVSDLGGTGTRLVVADASGTLSTQPIPSPDFAIQNQNTTDQPANFRINGSGQVNTAMTVGTALTVGTTLGVNGATTLNDNLTVKGNVVPSADDSYSLGTLAMRWKFVYTVNGVIQTSDARLKTNITGLGYGMKTVMSMSPVRYAWKQTPSQTNKIGFIAQELQKVVPEVVSVGDDANQTLGVNYAELVPVLVKALQEQQAQLETMRGRAEQAEAAVQSFEARLRALEAGSPATVTVLGQR
ncbi:MAG: hypothetical protein NVSMB30_12610 [Hymenobacter sp.]